MSDEVIFELLEEKYDLYNRPVFIESDPISIPHLFNKKEDIEIAGFLAATIAWGQRPTIIKNALRLVEGMDHSPHEFILGASEKEMKRFSSFKHRTFKPIDLTFFISSLRNIYLNHGGMEAVFASSMKEKGEEIDIKTAIIKFRNLFFAIPFPQRTMKHLSNPADNSAAKRLNMFLRWMVRKDKRGVDFGIWQHIPSKVLYCPLDVHSGNVARKLGLLHRKQNDWKAVEELTAKLRTFDMNDPVKYDFALFGLGIFEKF